MLSALGLTYEIAAGRVLAPFFGTSLVTWTSVIATVLGGFSLGSALGGFVAERPRAAALRAVRLSLVATAALMAVSPILLGLVYGIGARGTGGMVFSVIVVFFPASVFVTIPSPLLAKLAIEARPGREGSSLGIVLAAGSVGAIFGAVLAGFVTLPAIGSTATFAACGAVAILCLIFLRGGDDLPPGATLGAAGLVVLVGIAGPRVCAFESGLSCLHVIERGREVRLISDGTTQAAERRALPGSAEELALPYVRWIWARMDRDLGDAPEVLFVGGGGYTLPTRLLESREAARADVVEIDPLVTQVVRAHLPRAAETIAREGNGRLGIVHADGRVHLNETTRRYDAAVMDAFSSSSVPAHLVTREAFARLRALVDGPVYVNLIDETNGRLARGVAAILREIWPEVIAVRGPVSGRGLRNVLFAASDRVLLPLDDLPPGYGPARLSEGRAFTDDRGWIGHR
ncbi:fused MFS/spermidine synthase [Roseobacter sp. HKCCA0434]|uniref:fused MFS/spermidine synthase n=1 Tax=Roseobacter sp. HKCCA0434 TaxID=3079297 RepID=UPI0029058424|nr:fused MFS/spermidine synthase [Roseobacter sp. HKCCA0434]